ncbi:hypothetical protein [Variovorax sp. Sphag1AA]|uniref:hypothetical protein n=1 Tax=Variovorax sp. Sphag1AA TaxID=2587027 RepID=UPI00160A53C3|nr:hypothetical protein [Variovorax sp. Sphag1AA]MBB3178007.1 hypothetical protein [Variovorax sp. Sphag1AA]
MQRRFITLALAATLVGLAGPTLAAEDHHKPAKGGIMVPGKEADYELVAKPDVIQLYVSDHGKPRDVSKAGAKLTLLAGPDKQEVELKPTGDKLEATGNFKVGPGTKVVAVVTDGGKALGTARFTLK